jgi:hypothetical protein
LLLRHKSSSWTHLSTPGDLFLAPKPQFISIMGIKHRPVCSLLFNTPIFNGVVFFCEELRER